MIQNDTYFTSNYIHKFTCNTCDFKCCKLGDFNRHLSTSKHRNKAQMIQNDTYFTSNYINSYICKCGSKYKYHSGLSRHKKTCNNYTNINNNLNQENQNIIEYLLKENAEFKQLMLEQNKQLLELAKNSAGHHYTNNNTNNHFNLNFFLNETCKNAMNIMDFVSHLQVGIKDLEETGRLGFAEGISKIIINGLKQIDIIDRPVHCSDLKRETIYVKTNDQWNKEDSNKTILTNAIKHVAHKNMKLISQWTKEHKSYNDCLSKENDIYLNIVSQSMSGSSQEETNKNFSKIIKSIVKQTTIHD